MAKWLLILSCAALLVLQFGSVEADEPSTICGMEGFEFDTLQQATSGWSITVPDKSVCLIPVNYAEENVTSCKVYFSVCTPLPADKCGGNSSACQEVTTSDGKTHQFNIGHYQGNRGYETIDDKNKVGFATVRQGDTIDSRLCNTTFETSITWTCDEHHDWNPKSPDVTQFVTSVSTAISDCFLSIDLSYSGACYEAPTIGPDTCQISPYDVKGLTKHNYWFASLPQTACYGEGAISCVLFFSFCQAIPQETDPRCYGASACLVTTDMGGESTAYNLGMFRSTARFYENDQVVDGGFHIDITNGSQCQVYGLRTRIVLVCNSTVQWNDNQDLSNIIEVAHLATDPCQYDIFLPYQGACYPVGPTVNRSVPSPVGWILMGIFFFVVIVYFSVGAGYQYFVRGARGVEVIPNYEFWATFVMWVLEGCKFSLDIITCFQFDGTIKNRLKTSGGSAVDYDKI